MKIVITGGSSGIGYELAKLLCAESEHQLYIIARRGERLQRLAGETSDLPGKLHYRTFDLESGDIEGDLVPGIVKTLGRVDILINNAGLLVTKPFGELTAEDFDRVFNVNVKSVFLLVRAMLPYFNTPCHVVNMGSMGGIQGSSKFPGLSLYSAAKGAVTVLTECMAEELKEAGIRVNALAIGAVQTEMLAEAFPGYQAPMGPGEMAAFVANFALTGHQFFNGKVLPVSVSTP